MPLGFVNDNQDLAYSKIGASSAYCLVPEVHNCISSIVGGIESLPWDIVYYPDGIRRQNRQTVEGEILASDNDLLTRHPFQRGLRQFQRNNGFSLLGTIALDYLLFGEVFLEVARNEYGNNALIEWLNPLGVQVFAMREIESFRYGWNASYYAYDPADIAYLHNRNTFNDFVGYPQVLAVLDKVNILRNLDRFLRDYFINNARPALVVAPEGEMSYSDKDVEGMKRQLRESMKGVGNQYRTWILQTSSKVTALEQPDLAKNDTISQRESDAVYEKFGVPRAMRGNTSATPYKDGDETTRRFYLDAVLPLAKVLQQFINADILPRFAKTSDNEIFEFDTSAFDMVTETDRLEADILSTQLRDGLIDMYTASLRQENHADERLKGLYFIEGVPVPIDEIRDYWKKKLLVAPSVYNTPELTGKPLPEPTQPDEVVPSVEGDGEPVSEEHIEDAIGDGTLKKAHNHNHQWQKALYASAPDEDEITERINRDLSTWRSFTLRRFGTGKATQQFERTVLPPYIHHAVIDALDTCKSHDDIKAVFASVWDIPAIKSINTYQRALRELALALWKDDITPSDFRVRMSKRISDSFDEAFMAGVKQGGLSREDLDGNELDRLTQAIYQEINHVGNLAEWIDANSRSNGGRLRDVYSRVDNWVVRYQQMEKLGFATANKDKKLKWVLDPRKEHCRSCKGLNGQVRRGSYWTKNNLVPQSPRLECFLGCGCDLKPTDDPVSRGKMPRLYLRE